MRNATRTGLYMVLVIAALPFAASASGVSVYECTVQGKRIFSDQPCAPDAVKRDIKESNVMAGHMEGAEIAHPANHEKPASRWPQRADDDPAALREQCKKIPLQRESIVSEERTGYTAKQGEYLRERRDELDARYRKLRCERYR